MQRIKGVLARALSERELHQMVAYEWKRRPEEEILGLRVTGVMGVLLPPQARRLPARRGPHHLLERSRVA